MRHKVRLPVLLAGIVALLLGSVGSALAFDDYGGTFSDDDGNVHEKNIEAMAEADVTDGCDAEEPLYCPRRDVSRGAMAKFIDRAFDLPDTTEDYFTDDEDSIFEDSINRLAAAGITRGCNPPDFDEYCPRDPVKRRQMAVLLVEAMDRDLTPERENFFTDDDGSIFEEYIDELRAAGVTRGCNPPDFDEYCPAENVTRAQMATLVTEAADLPEQDDPTPFGNSTCDPAYDPCVPTVEEVGDLDCDDITEVYPDGVMNDLEGFGDPHELNEDEDDEACEDDT